MVVVAGVAAGAGGREDRRRRRRKAPRHGHTAGSGPAGGYWRRGRGGGVSGTHNFVHQKMAQINVSFCTFLGDFFGLFWVSFCNSILSHHEIWVQGEAGASNGRSAQLDVPAQTIPAIVLSKVHSVQVCARRLSRCFRPCSRAVLPYIVQGGSGGGGRCNGMSQRWGGAVETQLMLRD